MAAGFFSSGLGSSVFCAAGALGSDDAISVSRLRSFRALCGSVEVGFGESRCRSRVLVEVRGFAEVDEGDGLEVRLVRLLVVVVVVSCCGLAFGSLVVG